TRRVSRRAGDVLAFGRRDAGVARRDGAPASRARLMRSFRILIGLAAIMGADGVILAALSAHQADAARLAAASSMLLFHATAVLASAALSVRGLVQIWIGIAVCFGFLVDFALFAGDL